MKRVVFQVRSLSFFWKIFQVIILKKHFGMTCGVFSAKKHFILPRQLFDLFLLHAAMFLP